VSELSQFREWFEFAAVGRRRYIATYGRVPVQELSRDRGASRPTILQIHEHLLWALYGWCRSASRGRIRGTPAEPGESPTLPEIELLETQVDEILGRWLLGLRAPDLGRKFLVRAGRGFERTIRLSVRDMAWHLVEEEFQHRGEINALLWQIDVDPPILDWVTWKHDPKIERELASFRAEAYDAVPQR
jgi:uncharacterized damage-inducible protein DinB